MDKVVHFEIPYDEVEKAEGFYSKVFGWKIIKVPDMDYYICHTGEIDENNMMKEKGVINGGMYKRGGEGSKNPVIVIDVKSVDDYIDKVKNAGGQIVFGKRKVGDMGYYAQVRDTEGNIIGLWEMIKR